MKTYAEGARPLEGARKLKMSRLLLLSAVVWSGWGPEAWAQAVVDLGSAATFAVLGNSTVTNTGATVVVGDFGVSPGTAYTGFPPGVVVNGSVHASDTTASNAMTAANATYTVLAGEAFTQNLSGMNLGSRTVTAGVYFFSATAQLTGTLTLDAQNNPNARFDFQIGSTLGTAVGSQVLLANGAQSANVYWQITSSVTFLTSTTFVGNVLASTSITAGTGSTVDGRLFALNGAVTLDNNTITGPSGIPEPATDALIAAAAALGCALWHRRRATR